MYPEYLKLSSRTYPSYKKVIAFLELFIPLPDTDSKTGIMKSKFITLIAVCCSILMGCGKADKIENPTDPGITDIEIPELPSDPQPGNTSFRHRIMLLQHTGAECPNCPQLMTSLKELAEDNAYNSLYNHVASHSYNKNDAAYSEAASKISTALGHYFWPDLTFNLTKENLDGKTDVSLIKSGIDKRIKAHADAGISAAVKKSGDTIGINVGIKAAKTNTYRVTAWLLEDGIENQQSGATASWMHTHNNALRKMAGTSLNMQIYGEKLGTVNAGETAEKSFAITLDKSWKAENCKVLILVNADDSNGKFDLANCAVCLIDSSIKYEYN